MLSTADQRRCAVLGDPVAHSLSPALHGAAYVERGLDDWSYSSRRVPEGTLADVLAGLDRQDAGEPGPLGRWRGLSVTAPLKREALAAAATATEGARRAGGANTLVRDEAGWHADNTDVPGAAAAVAERAPDLRPRTVTVLGGGATAASTALAMVDAGATTVRLLVRSPERAAATARTVADHPAGPAVEVLDLGSAALTGEVLVSTIPALAQTERHVEALEDADGLEVVFEVLYDPWPTALAATAAASGLVLVGGLDLLVHQAALQFEQFTGEDAPLEAMRMAGGRALAERMA